METSQTPRPRCTRCGKGIPKTGDICTTCLGRQRQAENERRQAERIQAVVDAARQSQK